jgi:uncharacterized Tic20 family protein
MSTDQPPQEPQRPEDVQTPPEAATQPPQPPAVQGYQGPPAQMAPDEERTWAMLAHILSFVSAWFALGLVAPLIVMLVFGDRSAYVRYHAVESLNFQITTLIAVVAATLLTVVLIGLVLLPIIGIAYVVFVIMGGLAANRGQWYRYPVNLRLVK